MELGPGEEVAERDDAVAARRRHRALVRVRVSVRVRLARANLTLG